MLCLERVSQRPTAYLARLRAYISGISGICHRILWQAFYVGHIDLRERIYGLEIGLCSLFVHSKYLVTLDFGGK